MSERKFAVDVEGPRVTLRRLAKTASSALDLLTAVDSELSGRRGGGLEWIVSELEGGSVHVGATPEVRAEDVDPEIADRVLDAVGEGLETIEGAATRPAHFSDDALSHARNLTDALEEEGVERVRVRSNGRRVEVTRRLAGNVDDLLGGRLKSIGSVEGRLETIALHGRAYFSVYDALSGGAVRCYFPSEMLEEVREALGRRVVVSGVLWSNRSGDLSSVEVRDLDVLPREEDLPPAGTAEGMLADA